MSWKWEILPSTNFNICNLSSLFRFKTNKTDKCNGNTFAHPLLAIIFVLFFALFYRNILIFLLPEKKKKKKKRERIVIKNDISYFIFVQYIFRKFKLKIVSIFVILRRFYLSFHWRVQFAVPKDVKCCDSRAWGKLQQTSNSYPDRTCFRSVSLIIILFQFHSRIEARVWIILPRWLVLYSFSLGFSVHDILFTTSPQGFSDYCCT